MQTAVLDNYAKPLEAHMDNNSREEGAHAEDMIRAPKVEDHHDAGDDLEDAPGTTEHNDTDEDDVPCVCFEIVSPGGDAGVDLQLVERKSAVKRTTASSSAASPAGSADPTRTAEGTNTAPTTATNKDHHDTIRTSSEAELHQTTGDMKSKKNKLQKLFAFLSRMKRKQNVGAPAADSSEETKLQKYHHQQCG